MNGQKELLKNGYGGQAKVPKVKGYKNEQGTLNGEAREMKGGKKQLDFDHRIHNIQLLARSL
ncbi:MAG: hypothetical protein PVI84_15470 [Syntrophobacterales bacterium]|jgi:hypothetical protein